MPDLTQSVQEGLSSLEREVIKAFSAENHDIPDLDSKVKALGGQIAQIVQNHPFKGEYEGRLALAQSAGRYIANIGTSTESQYRVEFMSRIERLSADLHHKLSEGMYKPIIVHAQLGQMRYLSSDDTKIYMAQGDCPQILAGLQARTRSGKKFSCLLVLQYSTEGTAQPAMAGLELEAEPNPRLIEYTTQPKLREDLGILLSAGDRSIALFRYDFDPAKGKPTLDYIAENRAKGLFKKLLLGNTS